MVSCCRCGSWLLPNDASLATESRFLPQRVFNMYKIVLAAYFVFWSVYWPVGEEILNGWRFYTHYTFYVATIYSVVSSITAVSGTKLGARPASPTPEPVAGAIVRGGASLSAFGRSLFRLQIFTWNVACLASLVVVTLFWGVLYSGWRLTTVDINAHIIVAGVMIVDQFLVATEYKLSQAWASVLYGAAYTVFTIIFYFSSSESDRLIYSFLNWGERPLVASGSILFILLVLLPVFATFYLVLFRIRERIHKSRCKGATSGPPTKGLVPAIAGV